MYELFIEILSKKPDKLKGFTWSWSPFVTDDGSEIYDNLLISPQGKNKIKFFQYEKTISFNLLKGRTRKSGPAFISNSPDEMFAIGYGYIFNLDEILFKYISREDVLYSEYYKKYYRMLWNIFKDVYFEWLISPKDKGDPSSEFIEKRICIDKYPLYSAHDYCILFKTPYNYSENNTTVSGRSIKEFDEREVIFPYLQDLLHTTIDYMVKSTIRGNGNLNHQYLKQMCSKNGDFDYTIPEENVHNTLMRNMTRSYDDLLKALSI